MATVREDVVKVSFDVNDKALQKVDSGIDKLVQSTQKMAGSGGVGKMTQGFDQVAKSANALAKTDFASKITADIAEFNAYASIAKDNLAKIANVASKIVHPIRTTKEAASALNKSILGLQMGMGRTISGFKQLASTKISNLKTSLSNIKSALTEGQAGAKGFGNALKNIAKVSIVSTAHGVKTLATNLKGAAVTGAQKLASGLGKVAKVSMNVVVKGVKTLASGLATALKTAGQLAVKLGSLAVKGIATATKGLAVGAAAAATAIGALGTASIKGYAEFEQLKGGVETLFGAGGKTVEEYAKSVGKSVEAATGEYNKLMQSQQTVLTNANNAWKDSGLSANEYMTTVTSFSASMLQSLGGDTEAAAAASNQAVIDMADNANKMGTSMADIQNAYQGFAKQNYTMLDNLKLGYGGTKEEMERLLKDAEKLTGKKYDVSNFADITEAINAIQTKMGITGTTAKEASSTIQGSALAMKAAWSNFLTGMADENADFDALVGNLIESVTTFGKNLIPRIQVLAPRLVEGISRLAQAIVPAIPGLLSSLLPALTNGAMQLVTSLITTLQTNLPQLANMALTMIGQFAQFLLQALPQILVVGIQLITTLITGIAQMLPQLIPMAIQAIMTLAQGLISNLPQILTAAIQIILALVQGIAQMLPQLVMMALQLIVTLAQGLMQNLPMIIQTAVQIIVGLITGFFQMLPEIIQMGVQLIVTLVQGLAQAIPQLIAAIPQIFMAFVEGIMSVDWLQVGKEILSSIGSGLLDGAKSLWNGVKGIFTGGGTDAGTSAGNSITAGLQSTAPTVTSTASNVASTANSNLSTLGSNTYSYGATANSNLASGLNATSYIPTTAAANTETMTDNQLARISQNTSSYGAAANANLASGLNASSYAPISAAANTESMTDNELMKLSNGTSQYGAAAAANLASGISGNTGTAVNAASSMSSQVENAASSDVTVKIIGDEGSMASFTNQIADLVTSSATTLQGIPDAFSSVMKKTQSVASSAMSALTSLMKAGMNKVRSAVQSTNLVSSGKYVVQGLIRGMNSMLPSLISTATRMARLVKATTDSALRVGSPSKLMAESGMWAGKGLVVGYESTIPEIEAVAQKASLAIPYNTYSPDSAGGTVYNNGGNTEYTSVAPVFNLTVSGTSDDRATARKVKKWVAEAINETFASLEYKSRPIREV